MVQEVNAKVLGKWLELIWANGGRFKIIQMFVDDAALVADSEEQFCRVASEFGGV